MSLRTRSKLPEIALWNPTQLRIFATGSYPQVLAPISFAIQQAVAFPAILQ